MEENFKNEKLKIEEDNKKEIENLSQEKLKIEEEKKQIIEKLQQEKIKLEDEKNNLIQNFIQEKTKLLEEKQKIEHNSKDEKNKLIEQEKTKLEEEKNKLIETFNQEKTRMEEEKNKLLENFTQEKNKIEEDKKQIIENLKKQNEENLKKLKENLNQKDNVKNKPLSLDNEQTKLLIDIIYEFIFKTLNGQYYINVYDFIELCDKNYEILDLFSHLNSYDNYSIDDYLFKFFNNFQSYFDIKGQNGTVEDFLVQKSIKFNLSKPNLDLLKKISKLNIGNEKNLLEIYKERKEIYMKEICKSFDSLKKKYEKSASYINMKGIEKPSFLKIDKANLKEITINMNEINSFKFHSLFKYQISNLLFNLQSLTIITSSPNILILYNILINCEKLNSLHLIGSNEKDQTNQGNNISIIGETLPIILNKITNLSSFSINHIPIEGNGINNLKASLINSKISNLGLCYTKIPQDKFNEFSQYFKGNQKLKELDLSGHNCNILTLLKNTLFSTDNNITSLTLSDNNLTENDFQIISDLLLNFPKIKKLNISNNKINQKGCIFLGTALNKSNTLEDINLSNCDITGETIVLLVNNKGSKIFKNVTLDNNNIEDLGLVMLSQFIKNSTNLNSISLKNVSGSDMGFTPIISTILLSKSPIKEIHIEKNNLISENIIKEIIKNKDMYSEKGINFYVSASCVKDTKNTIDCLKLVK